MKENILKQFDESNSNYDAFGERLKLILTELLQGKNIKVHQISKRLKARKSLENKIDLKNNKYVDLNEITDVCGLRIVTYLESDVDEVAKIIETEFQIDHSNSLDKRKLKSDQFGYRSLHYVISLDENRGKSTENKKFKDLKAEIQVRSILQHAWAEIEHDLGYKGEVSVPEELRRNFNRLAALLETADIEFDRLKKELIDYESKVGENIKSEPEAVKIDQASIMSFLETNKTFIEARKIIRSNVGCEFQQYNDLLGELERFKFFKIENIGELERELEASKDHYLKFVGLFTTGLKYQILDWSLPLFYFQHFLAASKEDENYLNEYFDYGTRQIAHGKDLINTYRNTK